MINQKYNALGIKTLWVVSLAALIILPLSQAFRGLDLTDTGFLLTNQRFIFSNPQSVSYWFHLWLTNIIGGIWDSFFGNWGILPHRIAAAIIVWLSVLIILRGLYRFVPDRKIILISSVSAIGFQLISKIPVIHYNSLSNLFFLLGASALIQGALSDRKMYGIAGFVLALNIFVRLPNLPGLTLIAMIPVLNLVARDQTQKTLFDSKALGYYLLGIISGFILTLITMAALGHLHIYFKSVADMFGPVPINAGKYSLKLQILRPIRDTVYALGFGGLFMLALALFTGIMTRFQKNFPRLMLLITIIATVYILCLRLGFTNRSAKYLSYLIIGASYWLALYAVFSAAVDRQLRISYLLVCAIAFLLNIGSDLGIETSMYVIPALVPGSYLILTSFVQRLPNHSSPIKIQNPGIILLAFLAPLTLYGALSQVYRDGASGTTFATHQQLVGVATSEARAQVLDEALAVLAQVVPAGTPLLAYDSLPLIHFASHTPPYLQNPWPVQFHHEYLRALYVKAEKRGDLPPVLVCTLNPRYGSWPIAGAPPVGIDDFFNFLNRNRYHEYWTNGALTLLLPPGYIIP